MEEQIMDKVWISKCKSIRYEPCDFNYGGGYKQGTKEGYIGNGYYSYNNGYGWGTSVKGSRLVLIMSLEGNEYESWIDHFFKERWGRLTKVRREIIIQNMPSYMLCEAKTRRDGAKYLKPLELCLKIWATDAEYFSRTGVIRDSISNEVNRTCIKSNNYIK